MASENGDGLDSVIDGLTGIDSGTIKSDGSEFIDPAATATVKRGRHVKDCNCERCAAKRAGTGSNYSAGKSANPAKRRATAKEENLALESFASNLAALHKLAALGTGFTFLEISEKESEELALSVRQVLSHYNVKPDPVLMAWIQLITVSTAIYGPRIYLATDQIKKRNASRKSSPLNMTGLTGSDKNFTYGEMPDSII